MRAKVGGIAQLEEHLPYKQRVTGSSPVLSTKKAYGTEHDKQNVGREPAVANMRRHI